MSNSVVRTITVGLVLGVVSVGLGLRAADQPRTTPTEVVAALQPFQNLIGEWRGIGQPKRGSNRDAWQESAAAVWKLQGETPGILWESTDGRLWQSLLLTTGTLEQPVAVRLRVDQETERVYVGKYDGKRLVVESAPTTDEEVHRLTLTWLGENRTILLAEKRGVQQSFYQRVAEVAYQRQGTRLAAKDGSGPECIVTGGLGTIAVTHAGKTYYVCCTGCRDAFNDDPAGILAEWAERKRKAAAGK